VLEEAAVVKEIAKHGKDPLAGPLKVGVIFTIGPYLLPKLVPLLHKRAPQMPLSIEENYTAVLAEKLKRGEIDVAIVALPFEEQGILTVPVYDEAFVVAVPREHPWATRKSVRAEDLAKESLLLLGTGHCFRDQVLNACPSLNRSSATPGSIQKTVEGSSLETIRLMVASGLGLTVLPASAIPLKARAGDLLAYVPFTRPAPDRRVVIAWRKSFPRPQAIEALRQAVRAADVPGIDVVRGPGSRD
jgi:LysR family hydrogen peroxide-inducible transcriptional activator